METSRCMLPIQLFETVLSQYVGVAKWSQACRDFKHSIVEDVGTFESAGVAAHELGHRYTFYLIPVCRLSNSILNILYISAPDVPDFAK